MFAELQEKGISSECHSENSAPAENLRPGKGKAGDAWPACSRTRQAGLKGIEEMQKIFDYLEGIPADNPLEFDIALATGTELLYRCHF